MIPFLAPTLALVLAGAAWADSPPAPVPPAPPPPDALSETPPALEHVAATAEEPPAPAASPEAKPAAEGAPAGPPAAPGTTPAGGPTTAEKTAASAPADSAPAAKESGSEEKPAEKPEETKKEPPPDLGWARDYPPPPPQCWRGQVTVRVRGRYAFDEEDHDTDLYEYVLAKYRDELAPGWSGSANARFAEDVDGDTDDRQFFVFDSIDDAYDSPVTARLYHLYANYRRAGCGFLEEARIGRQYVDAGDMFLMDGVRGTFRPFRASPQWTVQAFAGVPAHLFESGPEGDVMGGVGARGILGASTEVKIDYAYIRDENDFYGTEDANLVTAEVYHRFHRNLRGRARVQTVNEDVRQVQATVDWFSSCGDASIRASFLTQPSTIESLVYDIDPYFAITQTLEPYWQASLMGSKEITEHFILDGGVAGRGVYEADDEGQYNREWIRTFATLSTWRWPTRSLSLALTGQWWHSSGDENNGGLSFEVQWEPSRCWRVTTGSDYSLWRTDIYADAERFDSWLYFVRVVWRPNDRWRVDGRLELENDDFDTYVDLNLSVRYEW